MTRHVIVAVALLAFAACSDTPSYSPTAPSPTTSATSPPAAASAQPANLPKALVDVRRAEKEDLVRVHKMVPVRSITQAQTCEPSMTINGRRAIVIKNHSGARLADVFQPASDGDLLDVQLTMCDVEPALADSVNTVIDWGGAATARGSGQFDLVVAKSGPIPGEAGRFCAPDTYAVVAARDRSGVQRLDEAGFCHTQIILRPNMSDSTSVSFKVRTSPFEFPLELRLHYTSAQGDMFTVVVPIGA